MKKKPKFKEYTLIYDGTKPDQFVVVFDNTIKTCYFEQHGSVDELNKCKRFEIVQPIIKIENE